MTPAPEGTHPLVWLAAVVSVALISAAIPSLVMLWRGRLTDAKNARQHEEQNAAIGEVREQVANDHDSNLRDDIDKILDAVALVDERTRRIGDDQRREVAARRDGDRRIADHLSDIGERLDRQDRIAAKHHPEEL